MQFHWKGKIFVLSDHKKIITIIHVATITVGSNYKWFGIRPDLLLQAFAARRIFELTDKDENGMIDQTEMFAVTSLLATGDTREKLKFLFAMYA